MTNRRSTRSKKENLKRFGHFLAGFTILIHALDRFDDGNNSYPFLVAAVVFLLVAAFHRQLARRYPLVDLVFVIIEAAISFLIAWEYLEADKKFIPYIYFFAGLLQISSLVMLYFKKSSRKHTKRLK